MKNEVLDMYYSQKLKQKEIAEKLNISVYAVLRIVKKDSRYYGEKNFRKQANKRKHNKDIQKRVEEKRKTIQFKNKNDDLILKQMHNNASVELSYRKSLSNENYRKWNYSAYKYNPSKKRYEFREELGRSSDVPKYIKERN